MLLILGVQAGRSVYRDICEHCCCHQISKVYSRAGRSLRDLEEPNSARMHQLQQRQASGQLLNLVPWYKNGACLQWHQGSLLFSAVMTFCA